VEVEDDLGDVRGEVGLRGEALHVAAHAERTSLGLQQHGAHGGVDGPCGGDLAQLLGQREVDGVARVGPCQREDREAVVHLGPEGRERAPGRHGRGP
jgi:hypothetical protein